MAINEKQLPKIEELEKQLAVFQAQIEELKAAAKAVTPDPETQTVNIKVEKAKVADKAAALSVNELVFANGTKLWIE